MRKTIEQVHAEIRTALDRARKGKRSARLASIEFTHDMVTLMRRAGVSRSELARAIRVRPSYVSKILRGDSNFSLSTMLKIANALGCDLRCRLRQPLHGK